MNPTDISQKDTEIALLKRYIPEDYAFFVHDLLHQNPVHFKIVSPRSTKLGDFKPNLTGGRHQITVNGNLNQYSFLITTIHEFAHLQTFVQNGRKVKPHGEVWQNNYRKLFIQLMEHHPLPKDIENAVINSLINVKASSCSDINLSRVLRLYDKNVDKKTQTIEMLSKNTTFAFRGRNFRLLERRRTRYLCEEISTKKQYLFYALTEVETNE